MKVYILCFFVLLMSQVTSVLAQATMGNYSSLPLLYDETIIPPQVMLAMSNDHQLFFEAYTDYDDLDEDQTETDKIEKTYENTIKYFGYFESSRCYSYNSTKGRFEVAGAANVDSSGTTVSVTASANPKGITRDNLYCNSGSQTAGTGNWSGNFLNWATMTRMDVVRKMLYGGYRDVDTATETVLRRAYLPNDAHSFAKYYKGSDLSKLTPYSANLSGSVIDQGITICNTTFDNTAGRKSQEIQSEPLMRVVKGNYSLWASNERWQCLLKSEYLTWTGPTTKLGQNADTASSYDPFRTAYPALDVRHESPSAVEADLKVRVVPCDSSLFTSASNNFEKYGDENCRAYGSSVKPIGLLQEYGDKVEFGLMTGSYNKNKSGGVLRKNVGPIDDEINANDGTFKSADPFTALTTGQQAGIIGTLNAFRIANWYFDDQGPNVYTKGSYVSTCEWGKESFNNGECVNWGNPFGEIMLESYRYFSGLGKTTAFDTDDSALGGGLANLDPVTWPTTTASCSAPWTQAHVVGFNASVSSYDHDELTGSTFLPIADLNTAAKAIGDGEGITNSNFFAGYVGSGDIEKAECDEKTISNLANVAGVCPEAGRLEGSYKWPGASLYVKHNDVNSSLDGDQVITTYGVALAPALPKFTVTVPGSSRTITLLPACRNPSDYYNASNNINATCAIVDLKVLHSDATSGTFYISWEDSEQGGDFDQDLAMLLDYSVTASELKVRTRLVARSTNSPKALGFSISGVASVTEFRGVSNPTMDAEGVHMTTGIDGYSITGNTASSGVDNGWDVVKFSVSSSSSVAKLLESPLFYAAKWGGFDRDGTTNTPTGWDEKINLSGSAGTDGVPDNYFSAKNPAMVNDQLGSIINDISTKTEVVVRGAGSSDNSGSFGGLNIQALYFPKIGTKDDSVSWTGSVQALFRDEFGLLRDDSGSGSQGKLDNDDNVVEFVTIDGQNKVKLYDFGKYLSYKADPVNITKPAAKATLNSPRDLNVVWRAEDVLRNVTDFTTNRTYSDPAQTGRHIFTSIDSNGDGIALHTDEFDFIRTSFLPPGRASYLDLSATQKADLLTSKNIVDYIRGTEYSDASFRSRTHNNQEYLLGDVANSTPEIVAAPRFAYDIEYGDESYAEYRKQHTQTKRRRSVVYVGGNDGMLHAFNAGICQRGGKKVEIDMANSTQKREVTYFNVDCAPGGHSLGAELWSYVPYNVLPHLKWLADPAYQHIAYVDGDVKQFDAKIFSHKTGDAYKGGWGTIIVVGLRLGGGDYSVDPDGNPVTANSRTLRSSYIVMDVTDPEQPPELIAEISHPDLGFTTSEVDLVRFADVGGTKNSWYLAFGSGPTIAGGLENMVSDQNAKLFLYDFENKSLSVQDVGEANSFIGGVNAVDWDGDFNTDALYFGTVGGTIAAPTGGLYRQLVSKSSASVWAMNGSSAKSPTRVIDFNKPFSATPLTVVDHNNGYWVVNGSGRLYTNTDLLQSGITGNTFFAVRETLNASGAVVEPASPLALTDLLDVGGVVVSSTDKDTLSAVTTIGATTVTTVDEARDAVVSENIAGWYHSLPGGERNYLNSVPSFSRVFYVGYDPSNYNVHPTCSGAGHLYVRDLSSGVGIELQPLTKIIDDTSTTNTTPDSKVPPPVDITEKEIIFPGRPGEPPVDLPEVTEGRESWRDLH